MDAAPARRERDRVAEPQPRPDLRLVPPPEERRTIRVTGRPDPEPVRRRRSATAAQLSARPDRVALWAVLLGIFLVFMSVATARADVFV
jgi:hypothetical protein